MGDTSSLDFMRSRKVFEINPEHEIIKALNVSSQPAVLFHFEIFRLVEKDCMLANYSQRALSAVVFAAVRLLLQDSIS